ncbi:hypothetical protein ACFV0D_03140 [Streptomyces sp. NPDC059556]|uniref:hypothetical protein n=1 Tax=Streptomyces sp. NPDC059556 TaxID=3346863 RepID=UPI0036CCC2C4
MATQYGANLLTDVHGGAEGRFSLRNRRSLHKGTFNIALSADMSDFEPLTKRVALVSDALLLSHDRQAPYHEVRVVRDSTGSSSFMGRDDGVGGWAVPDGPSVVAEPEEPAHIGIHCPDMAELGAWMIQAEPLMRQGLVWYWPHYSMHVNWARRDSEPELQVLRVSDYIIHNGRHRLVDPSESKPIKDRLIRPILEIELPFIEGVSLGDFSKITAGEFDSYKGFRNFLRESFLGMDEALNAEQTHVELAKLRLQIENEVRAVRAEMSAIQRKRTLAASGAVASTTAALLIAVNGGVMEPVIAALGLTGAGTLWQALSARVENSPRALQSGKWYYVWVLSKKSTAMW